MKIMVTGYSGSGKSTICRKLQDRYQLPTLHLDTVQFLPGWKVRPKAAQQHLVQSFLDEHPDGWVIDGNYKALSYERRCEEADVIVQLLFGRLGCLSRCLRRYRINRGAQPSRHDRGLRRKDRLGVHSLDLVGWPHKAKAGPLSKHAEPVPRKGDRDSQPAPA